MPRNARPSSGFTLIELLVVISLLGVLMGLSIGFLQRSGRGNTLIQAVYQTSSLLATARNSSVGNERAYVELDPSETGEVTVRAFRFRDVFHWPCEDLSSASEDGVLRVAGGVSVGDDLSSRQGRHATFTSGGRVSLGKPPWLDVTDGFSIECRLRPDAGGAQRATLFEKGKALKVRLVAAGGGRFDVEVTVRLQAERGKDPEDEVLRTGMREEAELLEWSAPILADRWQDLRVAYDRSTLGIWVDGSPRAVRSDLSRKMVLDFEADFLIGGGYAGGLDSVLISGIFEDDDDRFRIAPDVAWVKADGSRVKEPLRIRFLNRSLDPRAHITPVEILFQLDPEKDGPRRMVTVDLSGEQRSGRPGE